MAFDFTGKLVLVTGGSAGIGAEISKGIVALGIAYLSTLANVFVLTARGLQQMFNLHFYNLAFGLYVCPLCCLFLHFVKTIFYFE